MFEKIKGLFGKGELRDKEITKEIEEGGKMPLDTIEHIVEGVGKGHDKKGQTGEAEK